MPLTYGNGTSVVTLRPWTRCNLALDSGTCRKGFQTGQLKQGLVSDQDWMKGGHVRVSAGVKRLLIPADHSLSRIFCNRWRTSAQTATDQRLTVARSDLSTAGYTGGAAVNRSACANALKHVRCWLLFLNGKSLQQVQAGSRVACFCRPRPDHNPNA